MRKVNIRRMYHNCNLCEARQPKKKTLKNGKYLSTFGAQKNSTPSFHIYGGFHHEYNE